MELNHPCLAYLWVTATCLPARPTIHKTKRPVNFSIRALFILTTKLPTNEYNPPAMWVTVNRTV